VTKEEKEKAADEKEQKEAETNTKNAENTQKILEKRAEEEAKSLAPVVKKEKPAPTDSEISADIAAKAKEENLSGAEVIEERELPEDLKNAKGSLAAAQDDKLSEEMQAKKDKRDVE